MAQQERKLPFGKIEPHSATYFYSCALGGIVGMASLLSIPYLVTCTNKTLLSLSSLW